MKDVQCGTLTGTSPARESPPLGLEPGCNLLAVDLPRGLASGRLAQTAPGGRRDTLLLVDSDTSHDGDDDEVQEFPRLGQGRVLTLLGGLSSMYV